MNALNAFLGWLRVVIMVTGATGTALLVTAHVFLAVLVIAVTVAAMIALFELADHLTTT